MKCRCSATARSMGRPIFTVTPVLVLKRFPFNSHLRNAGGVQRLLVLRYLELPERENYTSAQVGVTWSAPLEPWLNSIRHDLGELPSDLELYVDYGDRAIKRQSSLSLGPVQWGHAGQSWVQFVLRDPKRNICYIGETEVDIR